MTKAQLEAVIEELVAIVDSWNDAQADDDRGRGNDGIVLSLWDDGSGTIGRRRFGIGGEPDDFEDWHDFADLEGLIGVLGAEGTELEEDEDGRAEA